MFRAKEPINNSALLTAGITRGAIKGVTLLPESRDRNGTTEIPIYGDCSDVHAFRISPARIPRRAIKSTRSWSSMDAKSMAAVRRIYRSALYAGKSAACPIYHIQRSAMAIIDLAESKQNLRFLLVHNFEGALLTHDEERWGGRIDRLSDAPRGKLIRQRWGMEKFKLNLAGEWKLEILMPYLFRIIYNL